MLHERHFRESGHDLRHTARTPLDLHRAAPDGSAVSLEGTLLSLRSPGQSYTATDRATQLQARLRISYALKDTKGNILLQEKSTLWTETYAVGADAIRTEDNRRKALDKLLDDIAEDLYLQILVLYDEGEKL